MPGHLDALKAGLADRYAIERELGEGGMATVYLARDLKHNRSVAVKVLKPELAASLGAERFLAEIEVTANLTHPHILPLHDSGQTDSWLYYVMPYVEGESLRDRIDRIGPLELAEAVGIAREVASALSYAHEQGVIHRDIKPGNLLLVAGHAVVADFGIARAVTEAGGAGLTGTGAIVGSPTYMSPEQANGDELDGRADLYALGCVLYEMLAGEPPFTAKGLAVLSSHLNDEVPTVRAKRTGIPKEVDRVIWRTMAKSPAERYPTAAEFGEALKAAARGEALRRHGTLPVTLVAYMGGGWGLFQLIDWVRREYFLPDWVRQTALALLLVGLPIFLATALLQRRRRGRASRARRLFSWRNAFVGGALALGALGLGAGGYLASRALGIGPAATLIAQGLLDERDPLILSRFGGTDSVAARTATEVLRIDLRGSDAPVRLMSPADVRGALVRMQLDPDQPLEPRVARDLAVREGVKAVIEGSILPAGRGFLLSVELVSPEDGTAFLADRETATDADGVVDAIDKLSRRLRARLGESLGSIRASPALASRTTSSLEALRLHTAGYRAEVQRDARTALARYEGAVAVDPAFAAAHLKVGIMLANLGEDRGRMIRALTEAYELREPLPEVDRLRSEQLYHSIVTGDREQSVVAGERLAEISPLPCFNNNLANDYLAVGDLVRAEAVLRPMVETCAIRGPGSSIAFAAMLMRLGRFDEAAAILDQLAEALPRHPALYVTRAELAAAQWQHEVAAEHYRALARDHTGARVAANRGLAYLEAVRGRLDEAESRFDELLAVQEVRGLSGNYLTDVTRLGVLETLVDGDRALRRIEEALEAHPLGEMGPHDRPYLALAGLYVAAGRAGEARSLLEAYEVLIEPKSLEQEFENHRVRASIALAEGDPAGAVAWLERMETIPNVVCRPLCTLPILGQAREMLGQPDSAVAVYERYLSTPAANRYKWDPIYLAHVHERLGQLHDDQGALESAARHYATLVELWADADEELQPRVRAARQRLEEILPARG